METLKVLKIDLKVGETKGKIRLLEGNPLEYKGVIMDSEEREYSLDLLKNVFGDWEHPHYAIVYKKQPKYRSFDLVIGTYEETEEEKPPMKRTSTVEEKEEEEFPFLKEDEVHCKAHTKSGARCKREPIKNGYCSLHQPKEE